jgi:PAS domain S-box-containing protein
MKTIALDAIKKDEVSIILEALPDLVYLADRKGIILNVNSVFAEWFGLSKAECIGESIYDLLENVLHQPALAFHLKKHIDEVVETGKRKIFEDDRDTWRVAINPVLSEKDACRSLLVTIQDISTLRKTSKELDTERSMKTALLDTMPCSAVILDADLRMIVWNRYAEEMLFNKRQPDKKGVKPGKFFCPDDMAMLRTRIREVIHSGVDDSRVLKVNPHGKKDPIWMLTRTSRIIIDGNPCALSIGIDISDRKRIEEELTKSKTRLDQALSAAHAGIWEWDAESGEVDWSDEIWKLYGMQSGKEKASVDLWTKVVHPDDIDNVKKMVSGSADSRSNLNAEYRVCLPDGSVRWVLSRGKLMHHDGTGKSRFIGTIIDITERKQMELDLVQSKIRFNYALDASRAGVWEWDVITDSLNWSEQIWQLYGLKAGSVTLNNQLCIDTVHPDDRAKVSWIIKSAVSKGDAASVEYRTVHPDGSIHWLNSRGMPVRDANGNVIRYIGAIIDITERKKIELEFVENKRRLDLALEAARAGVWEWDMITNENIWTDEVWQLYGLQKSGKEPSFVLWSETIHPEDREMAVKTVAEAAENGTELSVEYRTVHPDGSVRWLMSRGKPQLNSNGHTVRYIGTIIDITERKTMEIALEESRKRMTFALEATSSGVWEWDVVEDIVNWTDSVWRLYDMEPDSKKSTHKLCETNIHPLDKDITFEKVMAAANSEKEINIEYRVCHKDGSVHWLMCQGVPFYRLDGRIKSYIGTVTDVTGRKELLNDLMDSKMRLSQALEAARAGVWEWNLKSGENTWSAETWPLYGLDWRNKEKPSFDLWKSTIHPEDREKTVLAVTAASKAKTELNAEYRVEHPDGSLHWLMSRGRPLYNNHGKVDRYIGTVIDITGRKKIEEELQKSREKLDFILKKSHVGVWDMNLQNYHVDRSPEHAHIFGDDSTQVEWSLEKFFSHIVPEDRSRIQALIMASIHKKENYTFECRIHRQNGELRWIWVTGACQPEVSDNSMHVLGIVQDVTEQKKAEAAIRANESKFRNIFDHSPVAIGIGDVEKGILFDVNNALLELFGFDREEVIGRSIFDIGMVMNHEDEEQIRRELYGCRKIINTPFHFRKKTGEALNILFSAEYISINDRQALLVMMTDITLQEVQQMSIERLEQAVAERTGQLNEEVNRLNSFLSMITHEYRTPLAIIRGNLDLIELKNKRYNCVNPVETGKIHRAIDRLVELMEESIHESRVFESRTQISFKAFRISQVIAAQLESLKSMWPDLTVMYTDDIGERRISGDSTQFGLAVYNLLDNARKYSLAASPLELECRHEDHEAVIRIRNQGTSITEEQADGFFEKYRRGSNSMNTGGAGLGLWLVKNIIEQHKGTVSLKGIPTGVEAMVRVPFYEKAG